MKFFALSIVWLCMISISEAQTKDMLIVNASVDIVIQNSPPQTFYLRRRDQNLKREFIDSATLGAKATVDSLHYDLYVAGKEENLELGFNKKRFGLFVPLLAPGDHLKIAINLNNPDKIVFTGSALTQELDNFLKESHNIGRDRFTYFKAIKAGSADSLA